MRNRAEKRRKKGNKWTNERSVVVSCRCQKAMQTPNLTHTMNVIITHNQASIDPAATISDAAWPGFLAKLERDISAAIVSEYPDASIRFIIAEPCGNGVDIDGGDPSGDIAEEISCIINRVWEIAIA